MLTGTMSFAFNYIGHYITPPDWINHPEEVTCNRKRDSDRTQRGVDAITMRAHCDSSRNIEIAVHLGGNNILGIDKVHTKWSKSFHV